MRLSVEERAEHTEWFQGMVRDNWLDDAIYRLNADIDRSRKISDDVAHTRYHKARATMKIPALIALRDELSKLCTD